MTYEFTGKHADIKVAFKKGFEKAFTKSIEYIYARVFENCPVGKSMKGGTSLRTGLLYDVNIISDTEIIGYVGYRAGSENDRIAMFTEFGTGERGSLSFQKYFEEKKPNYTIPIIPLNAKALHWEDETGHHFAKSSKGQIGQAWMRRSIQDSKNAVESIWKQEFGSSRMVKNFKWEIVNIT